MFEQFISGIQERIAALDNQYTNQINGVWSTINDLIDASHNPGAMRSTQEYTNAEGRYSEYSSLRQQITDNYNSLESNLNQDLGEISQMLSDMNGLIDSAYEEAQSILADVGGN